MSDLIERYDAAIATLPGVTRRGKKNQYTAHQGHMFSFVFEDGLAVRLGADDKRAYEAEHGPQEVRQYGAVMRGYVAVHGDILIDPTRLAALLRQGFDYVSSLKPK